MFRVIFTSMHPKTNFFKTQDLLNVTTKGNVSLVYYPYEKNFIQEIKRLGKGAQGSVYQVKNKIDNKDYVLKKVLYYLLHFLSFVFEFTTMYILQ